MGPISISFDVTAALPVDITGGKCIQIAAWLFFPDDIHKLGDRPVAMVLLNGGSYDKRYFHVEIPGHPGYSAAQHLANLGNIVLVPDHLGMGESTRVPDQKKATRFIVAQANHAAVTQFCTRLQAGDLHPALPPIAHFVTTGAGHSMGAMQTIIQQAQHKTYAAVMLLGYTTQGVHFTMDGKKVRAADYLPKGDSPDYTTNDRTKQRQNFYWEDVPAAVIAADDAIAVETPANIGLDSIRTGIVVAEAATIDVPIYFGLGERDVSPDPHTESSFFRRSNDFTLHILERSAHCQNFASTRQQMWNRMHMWVRSVNIDMFK